MDFVPYRKATVRLKNLLIRKGIQIFVCRELVDELIAVASRPKIKKYVCKQSKKGY